MDDRDALFEVCQFLERYGGHHPGRSAIADNWHTQHGPAQAGEYNGVAEIYNGHLQSLQLQRIDGTCS
jgi:hypothetical protein